MGDVELRRHASRFLAEESVLRRQYELLGRVADFHAPPAALTADPSLPQNLPAGLQLAMRNDNSRKPGKIGRSGWRFVFLAASLLLALGAIIFWLPTNGDVTAPVTNAGDRSRLQVGLLAEGQFFDSAAAAPAAHAKTIHVGDVITTSGRLTSLQFDCGVKVLLIGPAELEILSPMRAALRRGTLTARVEESAHGFRIDTPNSKVIDLGTEFGLTVDEKGATDMVVFSGKIAMEYAQLMPEDSLALSGPGRAARFLEGRLLSAGEAMRLTETGQLKRLVTVRASDYPLPTDYRQEPGNWPPIIESVADNLREGDTSKCYQIVHQGFGEDKRAYVDRPYQWNGLNADHGLPNFLRGADYVMPFCDDKLSDGLEVSIALNRPARLYVLIDDRVELPQWLTEKFQDTGYDVGVDESPTAASWLRLGVGPGVLVDKCFSVWSLDVEHASTVVLGSMKSPKIQSLMYCVAAIPLELARSMEPEPIRYHQARIGSGFITPELLPHPIAVAHVERVASFADVTVAKPAADDAASRRNGVVFRLESNGGKLMPHKLVRIEDGALPVLNDGQLSQNADDLDRNVWFDREGRFNLDLLRPRKITEINAFSWHRFERAPQFFTVWGSNLADVPPTDFDEASQAEGWDYIGMVQTHPLYDGQVHASSLRSPNGGSMGEYRYLLWISEFVGNGTFYTEIDVHATPE